MKLVYHPEASDEPNETVKFYQGRRTGLGNRFLENVISTLETISHFPKIGQMDQAGYRVFRVKGFPFNVLKPYPDYIFIVAVAYQHRKHGYWLDRI